jgi:hypothetical protein
MPAPPTQWKAVRISIVVDVPANSQRTSFPVILSPPLSLASQAEDQEKRVRDLEERLHGDHSRV